MLSAFLSSLILFAAAGGEAPWWNKPGLEVWKFVNLFIFLAVLIYILRRPLSEAFKARREGIRRELMRAQEERNAALAKLEEVETRLSRLDAEVAEIRAQSAKEAADERERLRLATEAEIEKLREQSRREIESAGKAARQDLRAFAAEQSVRLAEEMIRKDIRPEDDARLITLEIEELGGAGR
ncbi:MAG TPA: ATP synthase F0 subunit B [Pyrinomonadaceae bacterium]|jgi:F0F1-type ATP synthase membrane subunit b/b'